MADNVISTGLLSDLSIRNRQDKLAGQADDKELGKDVFLELLVTQMSNQNPLNPQDNSEFVAQLAQFSSVEGIDNLNSTLENMSKSFQSSQALQASAMVGRSVKVNGQHALLANDGLVAGTITLPSSTANLQLNIYNNAGELVAQQLMGAKGAGDINFSWQGLAQDGTRLPAGRYRFEALATVNGKPSRVSTALSANVDSVTVGPNGTYTLNVAGIGPVSLSDVKEIL